MNPDLRQRRLAFVVGTRAQLIKIAPVVVACEALGLDCTLIMTGQHRETMQDLILEFGIRSQQVPVIKAVERSTVLSLVGWFPRALKGVGTELARMAAAGRLDVLVHGDTLSTLLGAFAGRRCGARVVHLESGLTSGRLFDPFPEEICRRLVFRMTDVAMCPSPQASELMRRRNGIRVLDTGGNTIADAIAISGVAVDAVASSRNYLLVSLHRFQNLYDARRLRELATLIERAAAHLKVHFILHPATRGRLAKTGLLPRLAANPNLQLSPRMGYTEFLKLAAGAACVLTDGGSNQEELAFLGVPTIVMRAHTERPDGLGRNAVMEADVPGGIEAFLVNRGYEALRSAPAPLAADRPSAVIARFLAGADESLGTS